MYTCLFCHPFPLSWCKNDHSSTVPIATQSAIGAYIITHYGPTDCGTEQVILDYLSYFFLPVYDYLQLFGACMRQLQS